MGEEELLKSKGVDIQLVNSAECKQMMNDFITNKPDLWNEDIGE
jgi:creatinine deaminase